MQDSQEDWPNGWWDTFLLKMQIYLSIFPSIYARCVSHASQRLPNVYLNVYLTSFYIWVLPGLPPRKVIEGLGMRLVLVLPHSTHNFSDTALWLWRHEITITSNINILLYVYLYNCLHVNITTIMFTRLHSPVAFIPGTVAYYLKGQSTVIHTVYMYSCH